MDTFDINNISSSDIYSSSDGFFIQKRNSFECISINGTKLIPSPSDSEHIYKWTFIICKRTGLFVIGLTSNNNYNQLFSTDSLLNDNNNNNKYPYYGYNGFNGAISNGHNKDNGSIQWNYHKGQKLNSNDKVEMELNLGTSTISYYINNSNKPGICFNNIKKGIIYRMVVSIYMEGDGIEITKFQQYKNGNNNNNNNNIDEKNKDINNPCGQIPPIHNEQRVISIHSSDSEMDNDKPVEPNKSIQFFQMDSTQL